MLNILVFYINLLMLMIFYFIKSLNLPKKLSILLLTSLIEHQNG